MNALSPHLNMDFDPNFEPMARLRAQTWPMNRFDPKAGETEDQPQTSLESQDDQCVLEGSRMGTPGSPNNAQPSSSVSPTDGASGSAASKKNSSRRNAWGNQSYADLITQVRNWRLIVTRWQSTVNIN